MKNLLIYIGLAWLVLVVVLGVKKYHNKQQRHYFENVLWSVDEDADYKIMAAHALYKSGEISILQNVIHTSKDPATRILTLSVIDLCAGDNIGILTELIESGNSGDYFLAVNYMSSIPYKKGKLLIKSLEKIDNIKIRNFVKLCNILYYSKEKNKE